MLASEAPTCARHESDSSIESKFIHTGILEMLVSLRTADRIPISERRRASRFPTQPMHASAGRRRMIGVDPRECSKIESSWGDRNGDRQLSVW